MTVAAREYGEMPQRAMPVEIPPFESISLGMTVAALEKAGVKTPQSLVDARNRRDSVSLVRALRSLNRFASDKRGNRVHMSTKVKRQIKETIRVYDR